MSNTKDSITELIQKKAKELGFDACGMAAAGYLPHESQSLKAWLDNGYHASMGYMNRNFEKRLNPVILTGWARSVVMLAYNYFPKEERDSKFQYKFSKYAYGEDYHRVIKQKLRAIVEAVEEEIGEFSARVFVDSAPILEKAWAEKCGLGWIGKNGCLINKERGSFFFLATIITNLDLTYNTEEEKDRCGSCTRCLDACPNKAIVSPGVIDANKCISYLSIEHKGDLSESDQLHGWVFGCDICQDVCPWNRFSLPHSEPAFQPKEKFLKLSDQALAQLDQKGFDEIFKGTAVERTGFEGLKRNLEQRNSEI